MVDWSAAQASLVIGLIIVGESSHTSQAIFKGCYLPFRFQYHIPNTINAFMIELLCIYQSSDKNDGFTKIGI